jgi:hypothetical protein
MSSGLQDVTGYIYPNEFVLHWELLIVLYPYLTGLVAGAFILASLERVFNVKALQPVYRLSLLTALAFLFVARTLFRDVSYPAYEIGHGHVRLRLRLVSDGGAASGNMVRLS